MPKSTNEPGHSRFLTCGGLAGMIPVHGRVWGLEYIAGYSAKDPPMPGLPGHLCLYPPGYYGLKLSSPRPFHPPTFTRGPG